MFKKILFHSLEDALQQIRALPPGEKFILQNAAGSMRFGGFAYIVAIFEEIDLLFQPPEQTEHSYHYVKIIDCDDNPFLVQEAMRLGFLQVLFSGNRLARERLHSIANKYQAQLLKAEEA